jgi:hypothetical protein
MWSAQGKFPELYGPENAEGPGLVPGPLSYGFMSDTKISQPTPG